MAAYVLLIKWTEQGMRQIRDSPNRLDKAKAMLRDMGGQVTAVYMTMGEYDLVVTCEAPDDAVAARLSLMLGMLGNVRATTLKAFPETAYREIINSLA